MLFLSVVIVIVVASTIIKTLYIRKSSLKNMGRRIDIEIDTFVAYENFIFAIVLSMIVGYLLYDDVLKTIDIYSSIIICAIIVVSAFRLFTQKYFKPIISDDGILFHNGIILPWSGVNEIKAVSKNKKRDIIVLIGGKVSNTSVVREKIVIKENSLKKFEILLDTKTNIK